MRCALVLVLAACVLGSASAAEPPSPATDLRVLFLTKSAGFEHTVIKRRSGEKSHAMKTLDELGPKVGFRYTETKDGSKIAAENLQGYDVVMFYTSGDLTQASKDGGDAMTPEGKQALLDWVASGKGFVGVHCASDSFHSPGHAKGAQVHDEVCDLYIEMLGGEFIRHGAQQKAKVTCCSPGFPGHADLAKGFELHEEWYALKNFAQDLHATLVLETAGMKGSDYARPPYPIGWARRHGQGRVFYTALGHREDVWSGAPFQAVLGGAIRWAGGRVDFEPTPNLEQAAPKAREFAVEAAKEPAKK